MSNTFAVNDRVRVLSWCDPGHSWVGTIVGFTAKDRTHVSKRVKGRREALVRMDGQERPARCPVGRLRRLKA